MNRDTLANLIAEKLEIKKITAKKFVLAYEEVVADTLGGGDDIDLVGFGKFKVVNRSARQGKNPKTGELMNIPETKSARFKVGKSIKDAVNSKSKSKIKSSSKSKK
ncbi:MAG: HU family DNA-binding protein [Clostridiales bacterium]|nr:HU family DNA-binding protein [Clostridiales bacterium]